MDFSFLDRSIVIARREYRNILFAFKSRNPELVFKVKSKEDVISDLSFSYLKDPTAYLMKKENQDYSYITQKISLLRIADISKDKNLQACYQDISDKGYIHIDDLTFYEYKDKQIYIFEDDEDRELLKLLERKGYSYKFIHFQDLGFESGTINSPLLFDNKFEQFFYIFSVIRKGILDNTLDREKVLLHVQDDDIFFLKFFTDIFSLPIKYTIEEPSLTKEGLSDILEKIYQDRSFDIQGDDKLSLDIKKIISDYSLDELDFSLAYSSLIEILTSTKIKGDESETGIKIDSSYLLSEKSVFVSDFQFDSFYKESKDNAIYLDSTLEKLSLNTSYIKTKMDERLKRNYLLYQDIKLLSRVNQHQSDSIYDSQFIEEYKLKDQVKHLVLKDIDNSVLSFTTEAKDIYQAYLCDKNFDTSRHGIIRSYDHSFKGYKADLYKDKKTYSVTDLEQYVKCPFKYLLNKILPSKKDDVTKPAFGNLAHKVMEDITRVDFNFDSSFDKGVDEYKKNLEKNGLEFTKKDEAFLQVVRHHLSKVVYELRSLLIDNYQDEIQDSELDIRFTLTDGSRSYPFTGRIDKILYTTSSIYKKYYTIIDFKTGAESFNLDYVFLGDSIQLPLYSYALENDAKSLVKDYTFGSFGLMHIYANSIKSCFVKKDTDTMSKGGIDSNFKLQGEILNEDKDEDDYSSSLKGASLLIKRKQDRYVKIIDDKKTIERKVKGKLFRYSFEEMYKDAKDAAIGIIKKIESDVFPISPTSQDLKTDSEERTVCSYCPYSDICYKVMAMDRRDTAKQIKEHKEKYLTKVENKGKKKR